MPGTTSGISSRLFKPSRPLNRARTRQSAAGTPTARPITVAMTASWMLSRKPETKRSLPGTASYHFSV